LAEAEKKVWTVDALAKLASGNRREAEDVRVGENALPMPGSPSDPNANRVKQTAGELLEKIQDKKVEDTKVADSAPATLDKPLSKSTDDTINKFKQLMQQNKKAASIARQPTGEKLEAGNALLRKAKQESSKLADITALAKGAEAPVVKPTAPEITAKAVDSEDTAKGDSEVKVDEKKLEEFLKEKGEEHLAEPPKSDESALDIDFFKLRRNMRFLQFQCEVGNSYNQEMREQFSGALQAFSRINVRYKEMHQRDAERLDLVGQVEKARLDLIDISDAKTRAEPNSRAPRRRSKQSKENIARQHLNSRWTATRPALKRKRSAPIWKHRKKKSLRCERKWQICTSHPPPTPRRQRCLRPRPPCCAMPCRKPATRSHKTWQPA